MAADPFLAAAGVALFINADELATMTADELTALGVAMVAASLNVAPDRLPTAASADDRDRLRRLVDLFADRGFTNTDWRRNSLQRRLNQLPNQEDPTP